MCRRVKCDSVQFINQILLPDVIEFGKLYTIAGWDVYITEILIASILLLVLC